MDRKEVAIIGNNYIERFYDGEVWTSRQNRSKLSLIHENCLYIFKLFETVEDYFRSLFKNTTVVLLFEEDDLQNLCMKFETKQLKIHYLPCDSERDDKEQLFAQFLSNVRNGISEKFPKDVEDVPTISTELRNRLDAMVDKLLIDFYIRRDDKNKLNIENLLLHLLKR